MTPIEIAPSNGSSSPLSFNTKNIGKSLLLASLPGLLAGAHLANLLFFLNPNLPFSPSNFLQSVLVYGTFLGAGSALFLTALSRASVPRLLRWLPWAITLVLTATATLDWVFASRYSYFLPPGINVRMIKAAIWLSVLSLICFYVALLHTLHHRPYRRRARWGLILMAVASVYVMAERREAFKPRLRPAPRPSQIELGQRPNLYVVGLDGATLDAILPLARQGRLPFFAYLLEEGVYARPKSFRPVQKEALWTTLATGRLPYKHGIVGDRAFKAGFLGRNGWITLFPTPLDSIVWRFVTSPTPIDSRFCQALAIWDVLERLQFLPGVVGWPVTDPVSSKTAFTFSDRYFRGVYSDTTAQPKELAERGILFRVDPQEIESPLLDELDNRAPYRFLRTFSGDLWRESLGRFLLDQRSEVRASFFMLPGLAEVSLRYFGGFAAVQFGGVKRRPHVQASQLVTAYYRHLDRFLAALWARDSGPRILAVVSAYGVEAPDGWHKLWAQATGQAIEGRSQQAPDGLFMMAGEGVRAGQFLEKVELVDIMPTLLYALGFPIARDLDGKILTGAFSADFLDQHPLTVVPSYETLAPLDLESLP